MGRLSGLLGMAAILGIAYLFSTNRKAIRLKTVAWGLGLQFTFALLVLRTTTGQTVFRWIGAKITRLLAFASYGSSFRLLEVSEDSVSCVLIACKIKNQAGFWARLSPEIDIIPPYQKLDGTQPGKAVRRADHKPAAHSAYPSLSISAAETSLGPR